jgi:hypothetical protein
VPLRATTTGATVIAIPNERDGDCCGRWGGRGRYRSELDLDWIKEEAQRHRPPSLRSHRRRR